MSEQDAPAPTEMLKAVTEDTVTFPASFAGASGTGQPHPENVIYGLPLEPLPAQPTAIDAIYGTGVVAVKVAGRDTVTFPAIPAQAPVPCQCGMPGCPDRDRSLDAPVPAETRVMLSCGPGVVTKIWREQVRNGHWLDITAEADAGTERVFRPTRKTWRQIRNDLDCRWHDIAAIFRADPTILPKARNETLARSLTEVAASLESGLAEMQRASAERWGAGWRAA